ncbi:Hypothetical protein A7982_05749 [Minicystis rosea]|nr:Hypothetical protein A7982_05749 [Minicystis rosea]
MPPKTGSYEPPAERLERGALLERIPSGPRWTPAQITAAHPVPFEPAITPALERVAGMTELQASPLALKDPELELLKRNGFVLVPRLASGNFLGVTYTCTSKISPCT